ncbi:hypothetical protein J3R82DRAFT_1819 [Butyriboletus roseoflavus]|nr:hypothetical protein J3R82DRAFT_1819 [Butyriboletus roseoflavus]
MLSCGVSVMFLLPTAFVTLPATRLEKLSPRDRLQIVSGGCFHNFVLSCLLFSAAWSGSGILPTWILFQDISALGRLIVNVDYDSPLATHLPVGTLITKIDDSSMASVLSDDSWDHYLLSPFSGSMQGWCTNSSFLDKAFGEWAKRVIWLGDCLLCTKAPACTSAGSYSCFVSKADETVQYELDPVHIFTDNLVRCNSSTECSSVSSCVAPRRDQQLVRIFVLRNRAGTSIEDIVIWKGPKDEIWQQVQVSSLRSRFSFVSSRLPILASAFFEYMKIVNLSLYLVNTLPIATLDGHQSLVILLQFLHGPVNDGLQSIDLEALNNTTRLSREGESTKSMQDIPYFLGAPSDSAVWTLGYHSLGDEII